MKILINLIGGQNFPNYYCSLKYDFDKIVNIYSNESLKSLKNLNICIQNTLGIKPIEKLCDAFSIDKIKACCREILKEYIKEKIYLNYTGGTKQMSIGAYDVFKEFSEELIYLDSQSGNFLIYKKNGDFTESPLKSKTDVATYLRLTGNEIKEKNQNEEYIYKRKDLTYWLAEHLKESYSIKGISILKNIRNNFASVVGNNYKKLQWKEVKSKNFKNEKDIAVYFGSGKGGWLEEWTYLKLKELNYFDNLEVNLKLKRNEFDIFGTHDGILNLFECKTSIDIENTDITKTYLNAKRYGGIYGKGFLICLQLTNSMKELADDLGLFVFEVLKESDLKVKVESVSKSAGFR